MVRAEWDVDGELDTASEDRWKWHSGPIRSWMPPADRYRLDLNFKPPTPPISLPTKPTPGVLATASGVYFGIWRLASDMVTDGVDYIRTGGVTGWFPLRDEHGVIYGPEVLGL